MKPSATTTHTKPRPKRTTDFAVYWWAYLHTDGSVQLKRYLGSADFKDADESPFVRRRTGKFLSGSRAEAMDQAKELLNI